MTDNISALKDIIPLCMVIIGITILMAIALMKGEDGILLTSVVGTLGSLGGIKAGQYMSQKKKI
jgi:hypothetical protein